jgi:hypothetical protein
MSRRKRNRFDRRVILNPVAVAIESAGLLSERNCAELVQIIDGAFNDYRVGRDCAKHWLTLADAMNIAEQLARVGICSDDGSRSRIDAAQRALAAAQHRRQAQGTWALRGPELADLDEGLFVHRIQLECCSLGEFERAHRAVAVRISQARAGNAPAGAVIVEGAIA